MTGLAQLVADRCAAIAEFKSDIYSHRDQDILTLKDAIEKTPIASPEDLKAALESAWRQRNLTRHLSLRWSTRCGPT
jgi:hypothetical protein